MHLLVFHIKKIKHKKYQDKMLDSGIRGTHFQVYFSWNIQLKPVHKGGYVHMLEQFKAMPLTI